MIPAIASDYCQVLFALIHTPDNPSPYGNRVYAINSDGTISVYAHLKKLFVKNKQLLSPQEEIGEIGMTGTGQTMVHLHFSLYPKGCPQSCLNSSYAIDPYNWLMEHWTPAPTVATNPWASPSCASVLIEKGMRHEGIDFSGREENRIAIPCKGIVIGDNYKKYARMVDPQYVAKRKSIVEEKMSKILGYEVHY